MKEILLDISMPELVRAADENLQSRVAVECQFYPDLDFFDGPELTGLTWPRGVNVFRASFPAEQTGEKIQQFVQHHRSQGRPEIFWIVSPGSQPPDLGKQLEQHGVISQGHVPVMAVRLRDLDYGHDLPDGFTVERIRDFAALDQWAKAFLAVKYIDDSDVTFFSDLFRKYGFGPESQYQLCMGLLDGQPVATAFAFFAGGVAGIYRVFTIPEVRGRGFGTAITLAAAQAGLEAGYQVGILFATEMGFPVYCRMGFQEIYQNDLYETPKE